MHGKAVRLGKCGKPISDRFGVTAPRSSEPVQTCLRAPSRCDALVLLDPLSWTPGFVDRVDHRLEVAPLPIGPSRWSANVTAAVHGRGRARPVEHKGDASADAPDSAPQPGIGAKTIVWTVLAMIAFAANSLLARTALAEASIDAAGFTTLRLAAGALAMWAIVAFRYKMPLPKQGDWLSAAVLCVFAAAFSLAYVELSVATGSLILFGMVQLTMLIAGRRVGDACTTFSWFGFALAMSGFVYLLSPGVAAPPPASAMLMAIAGVAWAFYCLCGRRVADPLLATAGNFLRAAPIALLGSIAFAPPAQVSRYGAALAVVSGAGASAVGFAVWYAALRGLSTTRAATVQLSVPLLAACGGVLLLAEPVTWRLSLSSVAILGGIGLVLFGRAAGVKRA